jgi:hypothetical protein
MVGIVQSNRMPYSKAPLIQSSRADVTPMHWHSVFGGAKDVDSNATLAIRVSLPGTLKILQPVSAEARRCRLGLTTAWATDLAKQRLSQEMELAP